jgi:hypothetical protein
MLSCRESGGVGRDIGRGEPVPHGLW